MAFYIFKFSGLLKYVRQYQLQIVSMDIHYFSNRSGGPLGFPGWPNHQIQTLKTRKNVKRHNQRHTNANNVGSYNILIVFVGFIRFFHSENVKHVKQHKKTCNLQNFHFFTILVFFTVSLVTSTTISSLPPSKLCRKRVTSVTKMQKRCMLQPLRFYGFPKERITVLISLEHHPGLPRPAQSSPGLPRPPQTTPELPTPSQDFA